jgi:hypothetical protein
VTLTFRPEAQYRRSLEFQYKASSISAHDSF